MPGTPVVDGGRAIDWGKTALEYAQFRPGPPESFFKKLQALDVGLEGQSVLDLGTGTGVMARQLARLGCTVTAADVSAEQVQMARALADREGLSIDFCVSAAEEPQFAPAAFDVVTANQCFLYFDREKVVPLILQYLKPGGVLVISHFSWLPLVSPLAKASEALILKHNPMWSAHSYEGKVSPDSLKLGKGFCLKAFFWYDEQIPFTRESWRGRIRACRGIGAALSTDEVERFDREHAELLERRAAESFDVRVGKSKRF